MATTRQESPFHPHLPVPSSVSPRTIKMDPDGKDKTKPDDKEQRVDVQPSEQTKEIKTTDICHNRSPSLEDAKTHVCDGIGNVKDSKWE